jgi:predicted small secreted protein
MKTVILATCAGLALLTGCNTMEGFGEDMRTAGSSLEKAASENNPQNQTQQPRRDEQYNNGGYNNGY